MKYTCDKCNTEHTEFEKIYDHESYIPPRGCYEGDYYVHSHYFVECDCGRRIEYAKSDIKDRGIVETYHGSHIGMKPLAK